MKNFKLGSLAALGLIAGAMSQADARCTEPSSSQTQSLMSQLNRSHQKKYNAMDCEGKNLAMKLANQSCKGENSCKGLNSCKSDTNSCAGMGSCKGTSPGPFEDKNDAVDVASKHMESKRAKTGGY